MTETPDTTPEDTEDTTGQENLTAVPQGDTPQVDVQDNDEPVDDGEDPADADSK